MKTQKYLSSRRKRKEPISNAKVAERQLLQKQLKEKRDSKLTKKLSTDGQLLAIAREELQLKTKVLDQMEEAEKKTPKNNEVAS